MTTIVASHGADTWVDDGHPNRPHAGADTIRLQSGHRRGFVRIPVTDIRGRTVLSATLTGHVKGATPAQTITVGAVADSWAAGKTTWNNQPGIGATVGTAFGAKSDGDAVDLDVTALLQAVANGTKWRGMRINTNDATAGNSNWYAFDSGHPSWSLTVELSDAPEQPSDLRPNIGAVAAAAPILAWSFTDLGGDSSEQGAFRVQVDPDADESSPAFDTGWVTSTEPEYDLSSGSFTPLASGAATQWRVATKDAAGNISEWSDWATFSYEPAPALTIDSPTGGVIGDSTPDVIAHLTGETLTQWQVIVRDAEGNELWNSGLVDGDVGITVPATNNYGLGAGWWAGFKVIARDDATYTFVVRAWGDVDRADTVGLTAYVEATTDVVFDDDAGVIAPAALTATPAAVGDPRTVFTWTRSEAADAWQILDDGAVYARLDSDDVTVDAGTYTWTDQGDAQPRVTHHFTARAIEDGVRSHASNSVTHTSRPDDLWVIPDNGDDPVRIRFRGAVDGLVRRDRRATFQPINSDTDVDIVTGLEGISGTVDGSLTAYSGQDVDTAVAILNRLRKNVYARPRLVFANLSLTALVRNLTVVPSSEFTDDNQRHHVTFDFIQDGD